MTHSDRRGRAHPNKVDTLLISTMTTQFLLSDLFSVKDLCVLVTGGGTGLGLHMATAFANNGAKGKDDVY